MRKSMRAVTWILTIVFAVVFGFFLSKALAEKNEYDAADGLYDEMAGIADLRQDTDESEEEGFGEIQGLFQSGEAGMTFKDTQQEAGMGGMEESDIPEIDFEALKEVNEDIVAWIICPGTKINYPVVQGTDDAYYLNHLFDGTENKNGCIFMDCNNSPDFSDDNTVLYGHNMANGSMFATLIKYADDEFYEEHPYMYLITEDTCFRIDIFSAYVTKTSSEAYKISFASMERFCEWIIGIAKRSLVHTNMQLTTKDRIVTLSTCSYEYKDARFVLHGRLKEIQ